MYRIFQRKCQFENSIRSQASIPSGHLSMGRFFHPIPVPLDWRKQLKIYCPLSTVLGILLIFTLFILRIGPLDFKQVCAISAGLCLFGFFLTGAISSKLLREIRQKSDLTPLKRKEKRKKGIYVKVSELDAPPSMADEDDASLPEILGQEEFME